MADKGPVTRTRTRQVDASERAVTRDRRNGSDLKEGAQRHGRGEDNDKSSGGADRKKRLITPVPNNIPGVSAIAKGDARLDVREIEAILDMMPLEMEEAPTTACVVLAPPLSRTCRETSKRRRFAAWMKNPKRIQPELDAQKNAVARALAEDAKVEGEREEWERWFMIMREHLIAARRPRNLVPLRSSEMSKSASSEDDESESDEESEGEGEEADGKASSSAANSHNNSVGEKGKSSGAILGTGNNKKSGSSGATSRANASPVSSAHIGRGSSEGDDSDDLDGDVPVLDIDDPPNTRNANSAGAANPNKNTDGLDDKNSSVLSSSSTLASKARAAEKVSAGRSDGSSGLGSKGSTSSGGFTRHVVGESNKSGLASRKKRQGSGAGSSSNGDTEQHDHGKGGKGNGNSKKGGSSVLGEGDAGKKVVAVKRTDGPCRKEERRVQALEALAMKRAGLEGDFDMSKVVDVLTSRSREAMEALREKRRLLCEKDKGKGDGSIYVKTPPHDGVETESNKNGSGVVKPVEASKEGSSTSSRRKPKESSNDDAAVDVDSGNGTGKHRASPNQDDKDVLQRWHELLRSAGEGSAHTADGVVWRKRVYGHDAGEYVSARDGMSTALSDESATIASAEDIWATCGQESGELQYVRSTLLVPRGYDLLPSMRIPLRQPTTCASLGSNAGEQDDHRSVSAIEGGLAHVETVSEEAKQRVVEYVPWIAGAQQRVRGNGKEGLGVGGVRERGALSSRGAAVMEKMQWFPRSLPVEAQSAMMKDERESTVFNTRAAVAIERLRELVSETAKRQEDMETKRREKAEEAVRLVRAAADHEKRRKKHEKRVSALRAQLQRLEEANRTSRSASDDAMDVAEGTDNKAAVVTSNAGNSKNKHDSNKKAGSSTSAASGVVVIGSAALNTRGVVVRSRSRSPIPPTFFSPGGSMASSMADVVANGQKDDASATRTVSSSGNNVDSENDTNSGGRNSRISTSSSPDNGNEEVIGSQDADRKTASAQRKKDAKQDKKPHDEASRKNVDEENVSLEAAGSAGPTASTDLLTQAGPPSSAAKETRERVLRGAGASAAVSGGGAAVASGGDGAGSADSVLGKRGAGSSAGGDAKRATVGADSKDGEGASERKKATTGGAGAGGGAAASGAGGGVVGRSGMKRRRSGDLSGISLSKPTSPRISTDGSSGGGTPRNANGDATAHPLPSPTVSNDGGGSGRSRESTSSSVERKSVRPKGAEKKTRGRPKGSGARSSR